MSTARLDPPAAQTTRRMAATRSWNNDRERDLRRLLHQRGLRFRIHRRIVLGTNRSVDIVFSSARVAVFVDGCFWHGCPLHTTWPKNNAAWWRTKIEENRKRDRDTDLRLTQTGWTVIRVWDHDSLDAAAQHVENVVRRISRRVK